MDVHESDQALRKHLVLETPRPPLVPADKNNGTTRRSRTREVSSRYKSPTPPAPRRCPSPNSSRTGTSPPVPVPKRAISAERRRPSTPPSPSRPATPVHDTSTDTHLASRKIIGSRLPEALWPSRMRSLSVSFQSDTFSLPISKREKPVTPALSDRTLKPSSNVAHKKAESPPVSRKPTPERKRSPLKGKNSSDQSENSKPVDGLHARLIDQHRWPSRAGLSDRATKASTTHAGTAVPSLRRTSIPDRIGKPLQKSASDAARLLSSDGSSRLELEACPVDVDQLRIPRLLSSNSSERMTSMAPALRSQSLPTPGSRPPSPSTTSLFPSSVYRGVSPSRTMVSNPAPSRGVSPSRIRASSPTRQSNSTASVLTFIADIRKGKKASNHIEDAHQLRLLYNRHLQWRYVNARAHSVLHCQKATAEVGRTLYNVWRTSSELWDIVTEKRIDLQQLSLKLKLYSVLNEQELQNYSRAENIQMAYLDKWALIERDHACAISGATEDLQASTLRLPVTGGAKADIETVKAAVCSAVELMQTIGSSICSILSKVEGVNSLVSELADVAAQERAMLDECESVLASTAFMQVVEEYSLRTHLIQLKEAWKSGE
ncbi:hypothetical protein RJ639_019162 [Escallonia herrerae]|uniref:AUGMIN subunit 8 n=1 Tax=Escallonia herrerae TaxID=1293975 RepID=A0AA88V7B8_9ASTE|nr:hypothetical protein RJ639_019162 [Escallonia herrerae]